MGLCVPVAYALTDPKYPGLVNSDGTLDTTRPSYTEWVHDNTMKADWKKDITTAFENPGPPK